MEHLFFQFLFELLKFLIMGFQVKPTNFILQWGFSSTLSGKNEEINIASLDLLEDLNLIKWRKWIHVPNPNYFWDKNLLDFNSFILSSTSGTEFWFHFSASYWDACQVSRSWCICVNCIFWEKPKIWVSNIEEGQKAEEVFGHLQALLIFDPFVTSWRKVRLKPWSMVQFSWKDK